MYNFSIDYDSTDVGDMLDIHKYLMKKHDIKKAWIYQKMLIGLLSACTTSSLSFGSSLASDGIKCISLNCSRHPTILLRLDVSLKPWIAADLSEGNL